MKELSKKKLAFIDIETTGLKLTKHEIIEIGALIYNQEDKTVETEWSAKIRPESIETADPKALIINGYINNPHEYKKKLSSSLVKFNSIVKDCVVVGQNVSFDIDFILRDMLKFELKPAFRKIHLEMLSLVWFTVKDTDIPGMSLETLCNHFGVCNVGAHSALVDCRRTFELYRKLENICKS